MSYLSLLYVRNFDPNCRFTEEDTSNGNEMLSEGTSYRVERRKEGVRDDVIVRPKVFLGHVFVVLPFLYEKPS